MKNRKNSVQKIFGILSFLLFFTLSGCAPKAPDGYTFVEQPTAEDQIVGSTGTYQLMAVMPTEPQDLAESSRWVISGKYLGPIDTFVHGRTSEINGWADVVCTKGLFEVDTVYKGDFEGKYLEVNFPGGFLPLDEYLTLLSEDEIKQYGYDEIKNRSNLFVKTHGDLSIEPERGQTYLLFLDYNLKEYWATSDRFGIVPLRDGKAYNSATRKYESFPLIEQNK